MVTISKDTPCQFHTSVAKDRLTVFATETLKNLTCQALDEARKSAGFLIFAYVIMPDHLHVITDGSRKPSVTTRYINGIISRRIIDHLKEQKFESSLAKLRHEEGVRQYKYSLWDHHPNVMLLTSEAVFMQRVNYIHLNPVRAGLVKRAAEYRWSSVRIWDGIPLPDEPLLVDRDKIIWRRSG